MTTNSAVKVSSVKRERGKAIISLNNGEVYAMPRAMLKERAYKSGTPFDADSFRIFVKERSYPFALEKAISLLSLRARTEREIVEALRRNVYPEETIARVMARLNESGYVNDSEFAVQFSSSRLSRGMGVRRIRMELARKGVDSSTVDDAVSLLENDDILESAIKTARKYSRGKDINDRSDLQKVLAALARKGFDYSVSREAVQHLICESAELQE